MSLPNYYWSYFDLRHEFERCYKKSECKSLESMIQSKGEETSTFQFLFRSFRVDLDLGLNTAEENDYCMRHIRWMESIVMRMLTDGWCYSNK